MNTQQSPFALANGADALVRRARDVLAGRAAAQPMVPDPQVERLLAKVGRAKYSQETVDWLYLQFYYGGQPVACFTTPEGRLAVLAAGKQVATVWSQLTPEEQKKLVIEHPPVPLLAAEMGNEPLAQEREKGATEKADRAAD